MPHLSLIIILAVTIHPVASLGINDDEHLFTLNVTMKGYYSTKEDEIVFIRYKLADEELAIVGYTPLVNMATTHHMDTFACENPASQEPFWIGSDGAACGSGEQMLLYGWDRGALPITFPEEVGIVVGKNTPYKYVVVNIHYLPLVKNDYSGNQIIFTRKRRRYLAGVALSGTNSIQLPPKTHSIKTPFSCRYDGPNIYIFAAGVHAHRWARVNSLYRLRGENVTLVIKGDPQQTHQSYLLPSQIEIVRGDYIIGQCVYDNPDDRVIKVGPTHNNEMCNVMVGYWYERNDNKQNNGGVPLENCYNDQIPHLSVFLPPDSEVPPLKSSGIKEINKSHHTEGEQMMTMSTEFTTRIDKKFINFRVTTLYMPIIIVACFIAVVVVRLILKKTSLDGKTRTGSSRRSIINCWFRRRDGFDRLEQNSDEEDELDSDKT